MKENLVQKKVRVETFDWSCDIFDVHKKGQVSSEMPLNKICIQNVKFEMKIKGQSLTLTYIDLTNELTV